MLAGGLLVGDTPVRDGVLTARTERGSTVGIADDPAAAAAWLAARRHSHLRPALLHEAVVGT